MLTSSLNSLSTVQYICEKVCCIRSFILNDRFIVLDHAGQSVKDFKDTEISSHNPDRSDVRTGVDVTGTGPLVVCDINQTAKANMLSESAQKAADRLAVVGREGHSVIPSFLRVSMTSSSLFRPSLGGNQSRQSSGRACCNRLDEPLSSYCLTRGAKEQKLNARMHDQ